MTYSLIHPPVLLRFRELSKKELIEYREWFMAVMPSRISIMKDAVHATPGFEHWHANLSPDSLDTLGEWFSGQVKACERSEEKMAEIKVQRGDKAEKMSLPIETWDLTNRTYSLAMDIGMYLGLVMRKAHPSLKWDQYLKNKRDSAYGQVSLVGTGVVSMDVVRLVVVLAQSLIDKSKTGRRLREIYNIWSGPQSGLFAPASSPDAGANAP